MGSEPRIKVLLYPIQTVLDLHELSFPLGYWWLTRTYHRIHCSVFSCFVMHHKYISKPVQVISSISTQGTQGSEISRNTDLVLKCEGGICENLEGTGWRRRGECSLICDGQASLHFGLTLLSLVLEGGFTFALWQLLSYSFSVRTWRNGDNDSNTVEEQTDHCPGRLLAGRW